VKGINWIMLVMCWQYGGEVVSSSCQSQLLYTLTAAATATAAELPQRLPGFLWQSVQFTAASGQPVLSRPVVSTVTMFKPMVQLLCSLDFTAVHNINWAWAETTMQQLLKCAVAAGVMTALPGSSTEVAAAALSCKAAGSDGSSSSRNEQRFITDIIEVSVMLNSPAVKLARTTKPGETSFNAGTWCGFLASPAVAEFMLQLLASRCLLLHKQHVQHQKQQQQQQQVLMRQLGKRMRGDLLLLADPRGQLLPLLPSVEFLAADAASLAAVDSSFVIYSVIFCLTALGVGISNCSVSSCSHPGTAAAVLQLFSQLLPMAAAHWQQSFHSLSQQQQTLLFKGLTMLVMTCWHWS
jgi:hypothetical protein